MTGPREPLAVPPAPAAPPAPKPLPVPEGVAQTIREFNSLYYWGIPGHSPPWRGRFWRGVPILKAPTDLLLYQELITYFRPDVIVECGVYCGGTTLFLADLCELQGHGRVFGIDVSLQHVDSKVDEHPRVRLFQGSSTEPLLYARIQQLVQGKKVFVLLDSDHSEAHVARELELYAPLVSVGHYLIVEDTNLSLVAPTAPPGPGPAVDKFLARYPAWQRDLHSDRGLLSFNPGGYLVRTR